MPVEPPPTTWAFPAPVEGDDEILGAGADLEPGTLLAAYRAGMFPMHIGGGAGAALGWWSPEPRGIIPLDGLRVTRSLRRSCRGYRVTVDAAFAQVIEGCATTRRAHGWINGDIRATYLRLHRLGWAHSVEAWSDGSGELAGGLYGVAVGGFFAGESMFHRETDASKVALVGLVERLREGGGCLLDVQWVTAHLATLGAIAVPRRHYLRLLAQALAAPLPPFWSAGAKTG
ncbi:MAG: leucyl/phenylalanyl-tRNA--protein transferase [Acidimicrobiales bacterium]